MRLAEIDRQVGEAFDGLVTWIGTSHPLGKIAEQPNGQHERTVEDEFCRLLGEQRWNGADLQLRRQHRQGSFRRDIVALRDTEIVFAVEVKTPFTNQDGINNKTRKKEHLPKDMDSLKAVLDAGAVIAYCLITPIGCYPVDRSGDMIVREPNSVNENEKAIKREFKVQWPTRKDYEATGTREVERAMKALADERNLEAIRTKGWTKVELPSPRSGIYAFMDCALYRVHKRR